MNEPRTKAGDEPSGSTGDNTASVTDTVTCPPSIEITKTAPRFAHVGSTVRLTMQVVNQLIKNDRNFDLLGIPGANHTSGGTYGDHKRWDFFVQHLLGVTPPKWTAAMKAAGTQSAAEHQEDDEDPLASPWVTERDGRS